MSKAALCSTSLPADALRRGFQEPPSEPQSRRGKIGRSQSAAVPDPVPPPGHPGHWHKVRSAMMSKQLGAPAGSTMDSSSELPKRSNRHPGQSGIPGHSAPPGEHGSTRDSSRSLQLVPSRAGSTTRSGSEFSASSYPSRSGSEFSASSYASYGSMTLPPPPSRAGCARSVSDGPHVAPVLVVKRTQEHGMYGTAGKSGDSDVVRTKSGATISGPMTRAPTLAPRTTGAVRHGGLDHIGSTDVSQNPLFRG